MKVLIEVGMWSWNKVPEMQTHLLVKIPKGHVSGSGAYESTLDALQD